MKHNYTINNRYLQLFFFVAFTSFIISCDDNNVMEETPSTPVEETALSGSLTENRTLVATEQYAIQGSFLIKNVFKNWVLGSLQSEFLSLVVREPAEVADAIVDVSEKMLKSILGGKRITEVQKWRPVEDAEMIPAFTSQQRDVIITLITLTNHQSAHNLPNCPSCLAR